MLLHKKPRPTPQHYTRYCFLFLKDGLLIFPYLFVFNTYFIFQSLYFNSGQILTDYTTTIFLKKKKTMRVI